MLTRLRLENFKSWHSLDIEIAPLTLLFGTNSSGKSSVLQAFLLLPHSFEKTGQANVDFGGSVFDTVDLGSYRDMVYKHDLSKQIAVLMGFAPGNENFLTLRFELAYMNDDVIITAKEMRGKRTKQALSKESNNSYEDRLQTLEDWFKWLNLGYGNPRIHYLGPIREYPKRSYLWSGTNPRKIEHDGSNAIAALIASARKNSNLLRNVSEWLIKLELVNDFRISPLDKNGRFYETEVEMGDVISNLLDVGFGISESVK